MAGENPDQLSPLVEPCGPASDGRKRNPSLGGNPQLTTSQRPAAPEPARLPQPDLSGAAGQPQPAARACTGNPDANGAASVSTSSGPRLNLRDRACPQGPQSVEMVERRPGSREATRLAARPPTLCAASSPTKHLSHAREPALNAHRQLGDVSTIALMWRLRFSSRRRR
jgi:hypothetical protein